jgi:K+-sensing histidine kinase KdpD
VLTGAGPHCIPVLDRDSVELRAQLSVAPIEAPGLPTRSILLTFRDASCEQRAELRTREAAHAMAAVDQTERQLRRYQQLLCDRPRDLERPVSQARRSAARLARLAARPVGQIEPERLALLAQVVERRTENVQRILQHLSDAALIEVGSFQLATERVNLVPVVSRVVAECRARAQAHRLNLGAPQGLTCECDVSRIESVLRDLLERAIRRNPRGCWIDVDLRRPLVGLAQVEVRDYGRSMSIREREGLMRASVADRGWSVHRYIVEQHGGSLEVDFPAEGGVRAVVSMPTHRGKLGRAS